MHKENHTLLGMHWSDKKGRSSFSISKGFCLPELCRLETCRCAELIITKEREKWLLTNIVWQEQNIVLYVFPWMRIKLLVQQSSLLNFLSVLSMECVSAIALCVSVWSVCTQCMTTGSFFQSPPEIHVAEAQWTRLFRWLSSHCVHREGAWCTSSSSCMAPKCADSMGTKDRSVCVGGGERGDSVLLTGGVKMWISVVGP